VIQTEVLAPNALKIVLPEKIQAGDFESVAPQVDSMIERGKINLLIDASAFDGWEGPAAMRAHLTFVKDRVRPRQNVERLGVIIGHDWQRGLVAVLSTFLHPHVRAFDKADLAQATDWVKTGAD
jgi:hypothetical protein